MNQKFQDISDREKTRAAAISPDAYSRVGLMRKYIKDQVRRGIEERMTTEGMETAKQPDWMMVLLIILIVLCAVSHLKVFTLSSELRRIRPGNY